MHSDAKKRRSFLALLFAAYDLRRWASIRGNSKPWQKALAITYYSTLVLRLFNRVPEIA